MLEVHLAGGGQRESKQHDHLQVPPMMVLMLILILTLMLWLMLILMSKSHLHIHISYFSDYLGDEDAEASNKPCFAPLVFDKRHNFHI